MKYNYLYIILIVILAVSFQTSCHKNNSDTKTEILSSTPEYNLINQRTATINPDEADVELLTLQVRLSRRVMMVISACEYYCDAYGAMPLKIEDILSDFIFIWPGNLLGTGPVKVINTIPDPNKPEQKECIFYERVNDLEAYIHFLDIDIENSTSDRIIWTPYKYEVISYWAEYILASENEKSNLFGKTYENMELNERISKCYYYAVRQQVADLAIDAIQRNKKLNESFLEMLEKGNFYINKDGFNMFKTHFSQNQVQYEIGTVGNDGWAYFLNHDPKKMCTCFKFNPNALNPGDFESNVDCLKKGEPTKTFIMTNELISLDMPENRMIAKEDIL